MVIYIYTLMLESKVDKYINIVESSFNFILLETLKRELLDITFVVGMYKVYSLQTQVGTTCFLLFKKKNPLIILVFRFLVWMVKLGKKTKERPQIKQINLLKLYYELFK